MVSKVGPPSSSIVVSAVTSTMAGIRLLIGEVFISISFGIIFPKYIKAMQSETK
jgi:hypothetical protein